MCQYSKQEINASKFRAFNTDLVNTIQFIVLVHEHKGIDLLLPKLLMVSKIKKLHHHNRGFETKEILSRILIDNFPFDGCSNRRIYLPNVER